jgi:hypothetical protein
MLDLRPLDRIGTSPPAGYRVGIVRAVEGDRVFLVELEQAIGWVRFAAV